MCCMHFYIEYTVRQKKHHPELMPHDRYFCNLVSSSNKAGGTPPSCYFTRVRYSDKKNVFIHDAIQGNPDQDPAFIPDLLSLAFASAAAASSSCFLLSSASASAGLIIFLSARKTLAPLSIGSRGSFLSL